MLLNIGFFVKVKPSAFRLYNSQAFPLSSF